MAVKLQGRPKEAEGIREEEEKGGFSEYGLESEPEGEGEEGREFKPEPETDPQMEEYPLPPLTQLRRPSSYDECHSALRSIDKVQEALSPPSRAQISIQGHHRIYGCLSCARESPRDGDCVPAQFRLTNAN